MSVTPESANHIEIDIAMITEFVPATHCDRNITMSVKIRRTADREKEIGGVMDGWGKTYNFDQPYEYLFHM
jgi:hypothetical protein